MSFNSNINYNKGDLTFSFLPTGDIYNIKSGHVMINQLKGNYHDGSLMNIYLRILKGDDITYTPLLGIHSDSKLSWSEDALVYRGCFHEVSYEVKFLPADENFWFYSVSLEGEGEVDLIYGQDLGLMGEGAVLSNEAYVSQYIDHSVLLDEAYGYLVTSKQNQPEAGIYPFVQHGCISGCEHFSTDGFQFFGLAYKESNIPSCLMNKNLADAIYQYETAYAAMQSKRCLLRKGSREEVVFFGHFENALTADNISRSFAKKAEEIYQSIKIEKADKCLKKIEKVKTGIFKADSFTKDELNKMYPVQLLLEHKTMPKEERILSFYTPDYEHVVTKDKELAVERPHGLIIQTGHDTVKNEQTLATTSYMYGVFNSQIVLGNTSFHKLISNTRNSFNVFKASGQRIYMKDGECMKLLGMPSLFEMGINFVRWIYKTEEDQIEVLNYVTTDSPEIHLKVSSKAKRRYQFYITNYMILGDNENAPTPVISYFDTYVTVSPAPDTMVERAYPKLTYRMQVHGENTRIMNDSVFFEDHCHHDERMLVFFTEGTGFEMRISGNLFGDCAAIAERNFNLEKDIYYKQYERMLGGFKLYRKELEEYRLNITVWWYMHNAMIHYASPHGMEQPGGAAWGTRDVCQGPFELMTSLGRYEEAKDIILKVYSHQFIGTGDWPQWFMFDKYSTILAEESHGDIIVWPLKILSDYIEITEDYGILDIPLPYYDEKKCETKSKETLFNHVKKQIDHILENMMFDTCLSNYGNGDWDDTLQPDNPSLKASMVSSWTVALTYQAFRKFAWAINKYDFFYSDMINKSADRIEKDFHQYLICDGTVSGFAVMNTKEDIQYLLHPKDKKTGITYRLLPMTRSMIAELFSKEEAEHHINLIHKHLKYNDGVRLMDKPVRYHAGKTAYFKRGEQAANFGREISLLYIHATIRYIEAMCVMGNGKEAYDMLHSITPAGIWESVENAMLRQGNLYFSSSDAAFKTRYEAIEEYDKLKKGEISVKGGWRLYSSGPGIYINQLITRYLGIRRQGRHLIIDPVIHEDGPTSFRFTLSGYDVIYEYQQMGNGKVSDILVNGTQIPFTVHVNKYRKTGAEIRMENIEENFVKKSLNTLCIRL